jgi:hypothetical protein
MNMQKQEPPIFRVDEAAILKGGQVAGQYLDEIGKSDLADLTKAEWAAFLTKAVGGALLAAVGDVYGGQIPF